MVIISMNLHPKKFYSLMECLDSLVPNLKEEDEVLINMNIKNALDKKYWLEPFISSRNLARKLALEKNTDMWIIDSDIKLPENARTQLEIARNKGYGIIGGLLKTNMIDYTVLRKDNPYVEGGMPTRYMNVSPNTGIIDCDAVGAGCMWISNDVLRDVMFGDTYAEQKFAKADDQIFCLNARDAGFKVASHTDVLCMHKQKETDEWV